MSQREGAYGVSSPQFQATPTSHVSSPSHAKSPGFGFQPGMSPVDQQGAGRPQLLPQPRPFNNQTSPPAISMPQSDPNEPKLRMPRGQQRVAANYYPSPFQKHYDQLGEFNCPRTIPLEANKREKGSTLLTKSNRTRI
jgi:hypothetical protein